MKLHPRLSRATIELVTRFETFQPLAESAADGGWTVGYGHTRSARKGARVSRADAEALLLYDLSTTAESVEAALFAPVTQRQFEALTAFAFNIGAENFRRSTALARVNGGTELDAADEIERWRHAELGAGAQVVDALVRRRAAEKAHFLGLPEGFSKSPSAVLRPLAVEGGDAPEPEPPPVEPAPAASATLTAANSVQARLRELVPEPEHGSEPEPPPLAVFLPEPVLAPTHDPERSAEGEPDQVPAVPTAAGPSSSSPADDETVVYVPPPPPIPAAGFEERQSPANDGAPPPLIARVPPSSDPSSATAATVAAAQPSAPAPQMRLSARTLYAALVALGACLLVAAAVMILGGRATIANLAIGIVGVLMMTPGVYGLLGPPRPGA